MPMIIYDVDMMHSRTYFVVKCICFLPTFHNHHRMSLGLLDSALVHMLPQRITTTMRAMREKWERVVTPIRKKQSGAHYYRSYLCCIALWSIRATVGRQILSNCWMHCSPCDYWSQCTLVSLGEALTWKPNENKYYLAIKPQIWQFI